MTLATSEPESLAAMYIVTALLRSLRHQRVLSNDEVDHVLERAAWPLRHREDTLARQAVELIDHTRIEVVAD